MSAIGSVSGGIPIRLVTGARTAISSSMAPLARKMPIATSIATRYGMIRIATLKPSLAPSTNTS